MAKASPTPASSSLDALLAAVSDCPDISVEFGELKAATDRVSELQRKAREAHGTDYHGAIKRAREALNATAAMHDIGRATLEELQVARDVHAKAVEALDLAPGRMAVFRAEIDATSSTLQSTLHDRLAAKLGPWGGSVGAAADRLIAEGLALVLAGLQARAWRYPTGENAPAGIRHLIAETGIYVPDNVKLVEHEVPVPAAVVEAYQVIRETERKLDALADFDSKAESRRQLREADLAAGIDRQAGVDRRNRTPYTVDDNTAPGAVPHPIGQQSSVPGPAIPPANHNDIFDDLF